MRFWSWPWWVVVGLYLWFRDGSEVDAPDELVEAERRRVQAGGESASVAYPA